MSKFANVKLGKLAPKLDHRTLRMASYVSKLPPVPAKLSWTHNMENAPGFNWHMYKNDQIGDCAIAGPAHIDMIWTRNTDKPDIDPTEEDVIHSYSKVSGYNPADPNSDRGCVMLRVMNEWRNYGLFNHPKIMGYVSVNPHNIQMVKVAIYLFGAVSIGLSLPMSAQAQSDLWSVTNPQLRNEAAPGSWGGHCCSGDTEIPMLDGTVKSIKELADSKLENFWTYGCKEDGTIVPVKAEKAVMVKVAKTVSVTLDDGAMLRTTPEHLFMLRNGTYKEASKLVTGDSLMPLYRRFSESGYEEVLHNNNENNWEATHHMVGKGKGIPRGHGKVTHHVDFNKLNNTPDNLEGMSWDAHTELHKKIGWTLRNKTEKARKKSSELMSKLWADPVWKANRCKKNRENGKVNIQKCNTPEIIAKRTATRHRNKLQLIPYSTDTVKPYNHKVVSVVENNIEEPVYDIVNANPTQNFCANGVFIHNCVVIGDYDDEAKEFTCITWGKRQKMSYDFFQTYCDEAYAALSEDWINTTGLAPCGLDLANLKADLSAVR